jgi:hypothetical protein
MFVRIGQNMQCGLDGQFGRSSEHSNTEINKVGDATRANDTWPNRNQPVL